MKEREMKYLPENQHSPGGVKKWIKQIYLDLNNPEIARIAKQKMPDLEKESFSELRVRSTRDFQGAVSYTMTAKNTGGELREELEVEINDTELNELIKFGSKEGIEKERYQSYLADDLTAEVDVYKGKLKGLVIVEVEYDQDKYSREQVEEMIKNFIGEGEIVSEYQCYKNRNLAKCKNLHDIAEKYAQEKESKELKEEKTKEHNKVKKIALTGGPCAGKSEVLSALKSKFGSRLYVVPEVATQLLEIPYENGGVGIPGKDIEWSQEWQDEFQRRIIEKQLEDEMLITQIASLSQNESIILCDRGVLDGAAYTEGGRDKFLEDQNLQLEKCLDLYDVVIHLSSLATDKPELYEDLKAGNPNRFEDGDTARKLDMAISASYEGHKNLIRIPTQSSIEDKVTYCNKIIESLGNIKKESTADTKIANSEIRCEYDSEMQQIKSESKLK